MIHVQAATNAIIQLIYIVEVGYIMCKHSKQHTHTHTNTHTHTHTHKTHTHKTHTHPQNRAGLKPEDLRDEFATAKVQTGRRRANPWCRMVAADMGGSGNVWQSKSGHGKDSGCD